MVMYGVEEDDNGVMMIMMTMMMTMIIEGHARKMAIVMQRR